MQCDAKYELYDRDKKLVVTIYCTKEHEHEGDHEQTLYWAENVHKSIMGS